MEKEKSTQPPAAAEEQYAAPQIEVIEVETTESVLTTTSPGTPEVPGEPAW